MDPRQRRTLDALLRAGEESFRGRTFGEVTVEEIAERAGVAVGSIYNHFGSKAGLHAALIEQAMTTDRDFMDRAYVDGRKPLEQLHAAADEFLQFYLNYPEYFRMLAFPAEPSSYPAARELSERLANAVDTQNARMVSALTTAMRDGDLRTFDDPQALATMLWAAWSGIISLGWRPDRLQLSAEELRTMLEIATDVTMFGLLPRE
jgi:TetR/AcrR family transcriptional regulator